MIIIVKDSYCYKGTYYNCLKTLNPRAFFMYNGQYLNDFLKKRVSISFVIKDNQLWLKRIYLHYRIKKIDALEKMGYEPVKEEGNGLLPEWVTGSYYDDLYFPIMFTGDLILVDYQAKQFIFEFKERKLSCQTLIKLHFENGLLTGEERFAASVDEPYTRPPKNVVY